MGRRVALIAAGSRGDVQPCVALGRELVARGHSVRLIASAPYEQMITAAGLELAELSADPQRILDSDEGRRLLAGGRNPVRFVRGFHGILQPMAERLLAELTTACKDADMIVYPTFGFLGHHLAEQLGVPGVIVHFQPSQPTRAFPHPLLPPKAAWLGPLARQASFVAVDQLAWQVLRGSINRWRRNELGLPPLPLRGPMHRVRRTRETVLACFSEAVVPRPRDWPSYVHQTGYWFLDEPGYEPPDDLSRFLAAGPPPVYVGFGSVPFRDPAELDATIRKGLRLAGVRGLMHGDPAMSDEKVQVIGDVPHTWLFSRTAAVVHHGGAGTTGAGLRAGVPAVVCPFFGDGPFWGERVAALGAGPEPLPLRELTAERLGAAIKLAVGSPSMRHRARLIGERMAEEDGVADAAGLLEERLGVRHCA